MEKAPTEYAVIGFRHFQNDSQKIYKLIIITTMDNNIFLFTENKDI